MGRDIQKTEDVMDFRSFPGTVAARPMAVAPCGVLLTVVQINAEIAGMGAMQPDSLRLTFCSPW